MAVRDGKRIESRVLRNFQRDRRVDQFSFLLEISPGSVFTVLAEIRLFIGVDKSYNAFH